MKKLTALTSLALLLIGCGGAGSGSGDLATTSLIKKVEQDLVCCAYWDEGNNTCAQYATPATKTIDIPIKEAEVSQEFGSGGPLLFEECRARFIPNPSLPDKAKDPSLINKMNSYLSCTGTDILPNESGTVEITYSQGLLNEIIRPLWQKFGRITLNYTIEVIIKYKQEDKEYTKIVKIPIDFDNFIIGENDMCQ